MCGTYILNRMPATEKQALNDVRMRGFTQRTEVPSALAWVDAQSAARLPGESIALEQASGRVLFEDVVAPIAVP